MSSIWKIALSIFVLISTADFSFAQSYSIQPNDTISITGMMEDLQELSIQQQNISSDTVQLQWIKISESVPAAWDASVCDNLFCYTTLVNGGLMIPVIPGDYGYLLLHITPHVNYGTAIVRYAVWDAANPNQIDTLTYILTVNNTSAVNEISGENSFSIFPNVANENLNIVSKGQSGFQYLIIDNLGKEIEKGNAKTNSISVYVGDYRGGIYSVLIFSENHISGNRKFIVQH